MRTTGIYLRVDPSEKLEAMEAVLPPNLRRGRFKVPDALIASLSRIAVDPTKYITSTISIEAFGKQALLPTRFDEVEIGVSECGFVGRGVPFG